MRNGSGTVPDGVYKHVLTPPLKRIENRLLRAAAPITGAAALAALYLTASHLTGGLMLRCPIKWITGLSCPGCGSQRALTALAEGRWLEAVRVNLLLPAAIIYLVLLWTGYVWDDKPAVRRMRGHITSPAALVTAAAVIVLWSVVRNIAGI